MFASRSYQARGDSSNCCIVLARNSLSVMWATTSSFGPPQPSRRRLLDIWFLSGETDRGLVLLLLGHAGAAPLGRLRLAVVRNVFTLRKLLARHAKGTSDLDYSGK